MGYTKGRNLNGHLKKQNGLCDICTPILEQTHVLTKNQTQFDQELGMTTQLSNVKNLLENPVWWLI